MGDVGPLEVRDEALHTSLRWIRRDELVEAQTFIAVADVVGVVLCDLQFTFKRVRAG